MKILIVEDDPFLADDLKEKLEIYNYDIMGIVESYDQAIYIIEQDRPDLVMLDVELKGERSGIDLSEELSRQDIPFIYLTGKKDDNTYFKAKLSRPVRYLLKPIDQYNLHVAIMDMDFPEPVQEISAKFHVFVDKEKNKTKINPDDVIYVKAGRTYCEVYFNGEDNKEVLGMPMKKFLEKLNSSDMVRVGKSYAINLKHYISEQGNEIEMSTGAKVPVTDRSALERRQIKYR